MAGVFAAVDDSNDKNERRCPRLGHTVFFQYCRTSGDGAEACFKLIDCWWESFDVVKFIRENFPEDRVARLMNAAPKPKTIQLVDLIEQARRRLKEQPAAGTPARPEGGGDG